MFPRILLQSQQGKSEGKNNLKYEGWPSKNTGRQQTNRGTAEITYWVVVEGSAQYSPFQGFRTAYLESTAILKKIPALPSSIFELYVEKPRAAYARINGVSAYRIVILPVGLLKSLSLYPRSPFSVFVSSPVTCTAVEQYKQSAAYPILHVSTGDRSEIPKLVDLTRAHLKELYARVLRYLEESGEPEMTLLPDPKADLIEWVPEPLAIPERDHGATVPNETTLKSLKFQLGKLDPLPAMALAADNSRIDPNSDIVRILRDSVEAVKLQKAKFSAPFKRPQFGPPIDTIIWSSGVKSHLQDFTLNMPSAPEGLDRVLHALLRQKDYPAFTNISVDHASKMFSSSDAKVAIGTRKLESELFAGAVGVLAAGHCAPAIRIRPAVNLVRGQMKQIAACSAANGPRRLSKLSKLLQALGAKLEKEIGEHCMKLIRETGEGIKLISNAPLEFLPIRGLPLQLRRTVTRLPVTPGDVLVSHLIGLPTLYLSPADLKSVLILRAFENEDPIRNVLVSVSRKFVESAAKKLDVKIVDIQSPAECVDALNSFSGNIVIFDCHGSHDPQKGVGSLQIASHSVHPLELVGKIRRMPPIVILSACDTHPLEWSDGSTASAFLLLGAVAVLATVVPVTALDAAMFTGRLLLRLADYVPLIAQTGQRWSDVITGLLRMVYVTALLRALMSRRSITEDQFSRIHYKSNEEINSGNSNWFEKALDNIAEESGLSHEEVQAFWRDNAYFTNALQYLHIGSPERIVIIDD